MPRKRPQNDRKKAARVARTAADARLADRHGGAKVAEVNTWLIFGFTEGADVGQRGEWTIFQDSVIRTPGRISGFAAGDGSAGVGYPLTTRAVVSLAATTSFERNAAQAG